MITISITTRVDLRGLQKFKDMVHKDNRGPTSPVIRNVMLQWAHRYLSFLQRRFDTYSKGGGDWKPLAPATIEARIRKPIARLYKALEQGDVTEEQFETRIKGARRKVAKAKEKYEAGDMDVSILRDTNTLFEALDPSGSGRPGSLQEWIPYGIRIGYGGSQTHPSGNGAVTIADIAAFHQVGGTRLPKREIVVEPPPEVMEAMREDAIRGLDQFAKEDQARDQAVSLLEDIAFLL